MILDCRKKNFLIQIHEHKIIEVRGMKLSDSTHIISLVWANKLLNQGYDVYLAYVINSNLEECKLDNIQLECEFPDVFLEELLGLNFDR